MKRERASDPNPALPDSILTAPGASGRYAREPQSGNHGGEAPYIRHELPGTCPLCWQRSADQEPASALCPLHLAALDSGPGCPWPGCFSVEEPFCLYHGKLAAGLIDPAAHDPRREDVLAGLPVR